MAPMTDRHRHYLLCPVCTKTQPSLSVHLRRACMRNATPEAIAAVVEKAKEEACSILMTGRVFSYGTLRQILDDADPLNRLIEELQRRHMPVTGIPPPLPNANIPSTSSAGIVAPVAAGSDESDQASVSSGETFQVVQGIQSKSETRQLMAQSGLYNKHSLDHPLLKDFANYLQKDLANDHFKQEAENVARFLFYMDAQRPSLEFVRNREKVNEYLRELSEAKLTKQTQQNYLKSLKRFLTYHTINTNLRHDDSDLHDECRHFIDYIGALQKVCSKQVSKEIVRKRHSILTDSNATPYDCLAILRAAKKDMLALIGKAMDEQSPALDVNQCMTVCYYLQAVVILRHLQRPGVVEHMTVEEWCLRQKDDNDYAVIGVKEHKTAAQQVATFALSQEEELWFDVYFKKVRPQLLQSKKRKRDEMEEEEADGDRFFVSSTGRPIYNATNDLDRLHTRYNVTPVTSQMARRVFEASTKNMSDAQKYLVADYLTHSTSTAEKHYRMKQPENVIKASQLLSLLAGDSSVESGQEETSRSARAALRDCSRQGSIDINEEYEKLLKIHPVTVEEMVLIKFLKKYDRPIRKILSGRWVKAQKKLRIQHILSHFSGHPIQPSERRVSGYIHKQGWETNVPKAADVVGKWKPPGAVDTFMDMKHVRKLTRKQAWKGLFVQDMPGKGKGVVTTRTFRMGEVVCDYHGEVFTEEDTPAETGYMFFYRNSKGKMMCIDAHKDSCECHPGVQTFGRMINHSRKNNNLRPRHYAVEDEEGETDVILFIASRDIAVGEELLFDCRVKKGSH